jgi:phosphoglycerol transferase MdoB-like AlkP superfamily enzyme
LPIFLIDRQVGLSGDLVALLKVVCLAAFVWHAVALARKRTIARTAAVALACGTGLMWTAVVVIVLYRDLTLTPFVFQMIVLSLDDASRTLEHVLGEHGVVMALAAFAAVVLAASGVAWTAMHALRALSARIAPGRPIVGVLCLGVLCYLVGRDLYYAANELVLYPPAYLQPGAQRAAAPVVPDYSGVAIQPGDSVFIVQLESVNSLALFEPTADGSQFRRRIAQPGLETILKQGGGVFFPLFWANTTQTHRAWEAILCAVTGNLGMPIVYDPLRLMRTTCLPAHLARAGYATVFLYSYFNLEFFNFGGFAKMAGFQDVAYGSGLMAEGDRRYQWAYDDCVFYERAFEYLAKQGLDTRPRLFAHFEVGMNHSPFLNSQKYPQAHPFAAPANGLEHYLNSVAEQDHCLLAFWERFRQLGRDDVHLFILPDHSVYGLLDQPDAIFATWLAYVPPRRRAREFKPHVVVSPVASQAQLYPTILELLGGKPLPASFAFALRGEPRPPGYDDCHLLTEPFSRRVVLHRASERSEFDLRAQRIVSASGEAHAADAREFQQRFACK